MLVVLTTLAAFCAAQDKPLPQPPRTYGTRKHVEGLPNFGEVTPQLYRGAQPSAEGLEALQKMGVSLVVDMRSGHYQSEKQTVTKLGMQYVSIPWHCPFPQDEALARFLKVIQEHPGQKVFVHCRLGDDRTGMAVAAYRMADEGWSADEAMKEMVAFGFSPIHHAMCPMLADYEKHFPEHLKKNAELKKVAGKH